MVKHGKQLLSPFLQYLLRLLMSTREYYMLYHILARGRSRTAATSKMESC